MGAGVLTATDDFRRITGSLYCEEVPLERLAEEYGTPLYVYSRSTIEERYRRFSSAFAGVDHLIAYSVKANGNLSLLRLLAEAGAGADIVSGGELYRALRAGIPAERIVFSGVGKTEPELSAALEAGIYGFNVESEQELRTLSRLAQARGVVAPIALRINPDIETPTPHEYTRTGHRASKFGVPSESALSLYREAAALPGIRVRGIAVHIGSQIETLEPYRLALQHLLELVEALRGEGIALEYLDLGGGLGVPYAPGEGEGDAERVAELAELVIPRLHGTGLRLVLEPGRYLIAPAGVLLTRVLGLKEMGDKTFVIADAGMTDLLRPSHYAGYHHVEPVESRRGRPTVRVDLVGPVCESGDFLALDRALELPRPGELLAVRTVGAYGFTMASQYNARPRPAEVLVSGAEPKLVRARETYEDLIRGEVF
jgi:diaminopimelate decarboxylase